MSSKIFLHLNNYAVFINGYFVLGQQSVFN